MTQRNRFVCRKPPVAYLWCKLCRKWLCHPHSSSCRLKLLLVDNAVHFIGLVVRTCRTGPKEKENVSQNHTALNQKDASVFSCNLTRNTAWLEVNKGGKAFKKLTKLQSSHAQHVGNAFLLNVKWAARQQWQGSQLNSMHTVCKLTDICLVFTFWAPTFFRTFPVPPH